MPKSPYPFAVLTVVESPNTAKTVACSHPDAVALTGQLMGVVADMPHYDPIAEKKMPGLTHAQKVAEARVALSSLIVRPIAALILLPLAVAALLGNRAAQTELYFAWNAG